MVRETINIPPIVLEWSKWVTWNDLKVDARRRDGVKVPSEAGVYEVKCVDVKEQLTIGKTSNLRRRIKKTLVKGEAPHSTGQKIRAHEDISRIVIRWAVTDRPAAVEEELHKRYRDKFGELPKYTKYT